MSDEIKTVGGMYEYWWEKIKPTDCHPTQKEEMRRAFYSGAKAMFVLLNDAADLEEVEAMEAMKRWDAELVAFITTLMHMRKP